MKRLVLAGLVGVLVTGSAIDVLSVARGDVAQRSIPSRRVGGGTREVAAEVIVNA